MLNKSRTKDFLTSVNLDLRKLRRVGDALCTRINGALLQLERDDERRSALRAVQKLTGRLLNSIREFDDCREHCEASELGALDRLTPQEVILNHVGTKMMGAAWEADAARDDNSGGVVLEGGQGVLWTREDENGEPFISIQEVIDFVRFNQKTVNMKIHGEHETFVIEFQDGDVVNAYSNDSPPGFRLGEILVTQGVIEEGRLQELLKHHSRNPRRIGEILDFEELVTREQLYRALDHQIRNLFYRLFRLKKASIRFRSSPPSTSPTKVRMNVAELLLEGARTADEATRDLP